MKKRFITLVVCALGTAVALALTGCGASLDRDITIQGMTVSVPSNWAEAPGENSDENHGDAWYTDVDEDNDADEFNAIYLSYKKAGVTDKSTAREALEAKRAALEGEYAVANWDIGDSSEQVIDGAQVTTYEYSFEKTIDHVTKKYEYKTAYVYTPTMHYEIQVYGAKASINDIVGSIEL